MVKATFLVKPNAKTSSIGRNEDGQLWIRISSPATEGKANQAIVDFLAGMLSIPKSRIKLIGGAKSRFKTFSFDLLEIQWDRYFAPGG